MRLYSKSLKGPRELSGFEPAAFRSDGVTSMAITNEFGDAVWERGIEPGSLVLVEADGFAPCAGTVTALEASEGRSLFQLSPSGSIRAKVIDGITSRPVAGATVIVCPHVTIERAETNELEVGLRALLAQREVTNTSGDVVVGSLESTTPLAIWLVADGYPSRTVFPAYTMATEQVLRLYAGAQRFTGRVVDGDGKGLPGVVVTAGVCGVTPSQDVLRATTIADGTFVADGAPPTPLMFMVRKNDYGVVTCFVLNPDPNRKLEFVLLAQAKFAGHVLDDRGLAVPGARLDFFMHDTSSHVGFFETYDDGSFDMPWVPQGMPLVIKVVAAGHVSRRIGDLQPASGMKIVLERRGQVIGRVASPGDGAVTVFRLGWRSARTDCRNESRVADDAPWRDFSSPTGEFQLDDVDTGPIDLFVDARGFERPAPLRVMVPPGGASEPLRIELSAARSISGRVVDALTRPIRGATVSWLLLSSFGVPQGRATPTTCDTDNDGRFTLHGLPDHPFSLRITDNVHANAHYPDLRADDFPRDLVYAATSVIEGRVAMLWTSPESAVRLYGTIEGTRTLSWIPLNSDGSFRFGEIPAGRWVLELVDEWGMRVASSADALTTRVVDVAPGETKHVEIDLRPGGRVIGRVTAPLDEWGIRSVEQALLPLDEEGRASSEPIATASCDADGRFSLFAIPPGRYLLDVSSRIVGSVATHRQVVEVGDGASIVTVDVRLAEPSLKGRVIDGDDRPVSADVRVVGADGVEFAWVHADHEGRWRVAAPPSGDFRLVVSAPGFATQHSEPIDADRPPEEEFELVLESEARLAITVKDDAGAPIAGADITVVERGATAGANWRGRTTYDGSATATRLPAGAFDVVARHAQWPAVSPTTVDLEWGETRRLTLTLTRFGRASIEVVDRDGRPLAERSVVLQSEAAFVAARTLTSDASGRATVDQLPAGRWSARSGSSTPTPFEVRPGAEASVRIVVE